jgi:hypothetical protein
MCEALPTGSRLHNVVLRHNNDYFYVFSITTHICKRYETYKRFPDFRLSWWLNADENTFFGCYIVWMWTMLPTLWRYIMPSSSGSKVYNLNEFYVYSETPHTQSSPLLKKRLKCSILYAIEKYI